MRLFILIATILLVSTSSQAWFDTSASRLPTYCPLCNDVYCNGTSAHSKWDTQNDQVNVKKGQGLAYIFATGPDLFDPSRALHVKGRFVYRGRWPKDAESIYARGVIDQLIQRIRDDYPLAYAKQLDSFTEEKLWQVYEELKTNGQRIERILLVITAHGGVDECYSIWTQQGKLREDQLLDIIRDTPTETILFTCHAGAVATEHFPGSVFATSLKHTPMDAAHFYDWARFVQTRNDHYFPASAKEFHDSWLESMLERRLAQQNDSLLMRLASWLTGEYKANKAKEMQMLSNTCWPYAYPFLLNERIPIIE